MAVLGGVSGFRLPRAPTPDEEQRIRDAIALAEAYSAQQRRALNIPDPRAYGGVPMQGPTSVTTFRPSLLQQSQTPESKQQGQVISGAGRIARALLFPPKPQGTPPIVPGRPVPPQPSTNVPTITPAIEAKIEGIGQDITGASQSADPLAAGQEVGQVAAPQILRPATIEPPMDPGSAKTVTVEGSARAGGVDLGQALWDAGAFLVYLFGGEGGKGSRDTERAPKREEGGQPGRHPFRPKRKRVRGKVPAGPRPFPGE